MQAINLITVGEISRALRAPLAQVHYILSKHPEIAEVGRVGGYRVYDPKDLPRIAVGIKGIKHRNRVVV